MLLSLTGGVSDKWLVNQKIKLMHLLERAINYKNKYQILLMSFSRDDRQC